MYPSLQKDSKENNIEKILENREYCRMCEIVDKMTEDFKKEKEK